MLIEAVEKRFGTVEAVPARGTRPGQVPRERIARSRGFGRPARFKPDRSPIVDFRLALEVALLVVH
jgi:hypothetical protein